MDGAFLFRKRVEGLGPQTSASDGGGAPRAVPAAGAARAQLNRLRESIERAAALLPLPGPITAFAFLNTLQALETMPFDEGMVKGARLYGCQPYLLEDKYREHIASGRIRRDDVEAVLAEDSGPDADASLGVLGTRFDLRLAMLLFSSPRGPAEELRWYVAEMDALAKFCTDVPPAMRSRMIDETRQWVAALGQDHITSRESQILDSLSEITRRFNESRATEGNRSVSDEALTLQLLWRLCYWSLQDVELGSRTVHPSLRPRDALLSATGEDADLLVHEVLIRFCAAYTDQGFAGWPLPLRNRGFFASFRHLHSSHSGPATHWLRFLSEEVLRLDASGIDPLESIRESCTMLGIEEADWEEFLLATLLTLRGWAGMLWQMEVRPDRVPFPVPRGTLIEFLAVRLMLDRLALAHLAAQTLGYRGAVDRVREALPPPGGEAATSIDQRAFVIFQLAQRLGWSPPMLARLSRQEWAALVAEVEGFSELERRRLLHRAFERRLHTRALDAVSVYGQRQTRRVKAPCFQAVLCIDAREESFRRHIEEVAPNAETFGAAGFFGVPIYYRGAADAHFAALCPIVVMPKHWVVEDVVYTLGESHRRRASVRRALGNASHQVHVGSRSMAGGALLAAGLGVLATVPLVARVLFPRSTARFRQMTSRIVSAPTTTRLRLERTSADPGPNEGQIGFTVAEMADFSERLLRDIGLTSGFARLVIFLGHGSFSVNNPHKSVYDCGACTGSAGSPNGRTLAAMLNDARIREILADRRLKIPNGTRFLGGLHNTCDDTVTFFDLDLLPATHYQDIAAVERILEEACDRNAHERCRRFHSAPLDLTFEAAHRHVERRSQDLAQARPEFGNASNAMCVVGRRQRTRGLYLDRRSFLMSYDAAQDDERHTILERILSAVVPVCEGINMQYFLSYVDSTGWACGTKLPHNVTSLLGVMDGAASDLRPGLPWQGVEIHEPVRLVFVIEATPEAMWQIMNRNETIGRILKNGWARLAVLSPHSGDVQVFRDGDFHLHVPSLHDLPYAPTSTDWYRGIRDHMDFAAIGASVVSQAPAESEIETCLSTN